MCCTATAPRAAPTRGSPRRSAIRVYTPHGGSLHYGRSSPVGLLYLTLEQVLMARTELFLFESAYGRDAFTAKIGTPRSLVRVVHNGVTESEFADVAPQPDATDVVFIGELRHLKGVDVLLDALAHPGARRPPGERDDHRRRPRRRAIPRAGRSGLALVLQSVSSARCRRATASRAGA